MVPTTAVAAVLALLGAVVCLLSPGAHGFHCVEDDTIEYRLLRSSIPLTNVARRHTSALLVDLTCTARHEQHYDVHGAIRPDKNTPQSATDGQSDPSPVEALVFDAALAPNGTFLAIRSNAKTKEELLHRDAIVEVLMMMHVEPDSRPVSPTVRHHSSFTANGLQNISTAHRATRHIGGPVVRSQRFLRAEIHEASMHVISDLHLRTARTEKPRRITAPPAVLLSAGAARQSRPITLEDVHVVNSTGSAEANTTATLTALCGQWTATVKGTYAELNTHLIADSLHSIPPLCAAVDLTLTDGAETIKHSVALRKADAAARAEAEELPLNTYHMQHRCAAPETLQETFGSESPADALSALLTEFFITRNITDDRSAYPDGHGMTPPVVLRLSTFLGCHPELIQTFTAATLHTTHLPETKCDDAANVLNSVQHPAADDAFASCLDDHPDDDKPRCCADPHFLAIHAAHRPILSRAVVTKLVAYVGNHGLESAIAVRAIAMWDENRHTKVAVFGETLVSAGEAPETKEDFAKDTEGNRTQYGARRAFSAQSAFSDKLLSDVFSYHIDLSTDDFFKWFGGRTLGVGFGVLFKNEATVRLSYAGALDVNLDIDNEAGLKLRFFGRECAPYNVKMKIKGDIEFDILAFALAQTCPSGGAPVQSAASHAANGRQLAKQADDVHYEAPIIWGAATPLALLLQWGLLVPDLPTSRAAAAQELSVNAESKPKHYWPDPAPRSPLPYRARTMPARNVTVSSGRAFTALAFPQCSIASCGLYACLETQRPCGDSGYNVKTGLPVCLSLLFKTMTATSIKTANFFGRVSQCLRGRAAAAAGSGTCASYAAQMEGEVSGCLLEAGFCALPSEDMATALEALGEENRPGAAALFRADNADGCMHQSRIGSFLDSVHVEAVATNENSNLDSVCEAKFASPRVFCAHSEPNNADGKGRHLVLTPKSTKHELLQLAETRAASSKTCFMPDCVCYLNRREFSPVVAIATEPEFVEPDLEVVPGTKNCFVIYAHDAGDCTTNFLRDYALLERCVETNAKLYPAPDLNSFPKDLEIWERIKSYAIATLPERVLDSGSAACDAFKQCKKTKGLRGCSAEGKKCTMEGSDEGNTLAASLTSLLLVQLFGRDVDPSKPWAPCHDMYYNCLDNDNGRCSDKLFACNIAPITQWYTGSCEILSPRVLWESIQSHVAAWYMENLRFFLLGVAGAQWAATCACSTLAKTAPLDNFDSSNAYIRTTKHGVQRNRGIFPNKRNFLKGRGQSPVSFDTGCMPPIPIPKVRPKAGLSVNFDFTPYQGFFLDADVKFDAPTNFRAAQSENMAITLTAIPGWRLGFKMTLSASASVDAVVFSAKISIDLVSEVYGIKGTVSPFATMNLIGQPALPTITSYGLIPEFILGEVQIYLKLKICVKVFGIGKCKKKKWNVKKVRAYHWRKVLKSGQSSTIKQSAPVFNGYHAAGGKRWISGRTVLCTLPEKPTTVCPLDQLTVFMTATKPDGGVFKTHVVDITDSVLEQRFSITDASPTSSDVNEFEGARLRCTFKATACKAGLSTEVTTDWVGVSNVAPLPSPRRGFFHGVDHPYAASFHRRCFTFSASLPIALAANIGLTLMNADTGTPIRQWATYGRRRFCFEGIMQPRLILFVTITSGSGVPGFGFTSPAGVDPIPVGFSEVTVGCTEAERADGWLIGGTPLCVTANIMAGVSGVGPRKYINVLDSTYKRVFYHRVVSQGPVPINETVEAPFMSITGSYMIQTMAVRGAGALDGSDFIRIQVDATPPTKGNAAHVDPDSRERLDRASSNLRETCIAWSGFDDLHSGMRGVTWDMTCDGTPMWPAGSLVWAFDIEAEKVLCKSRGIPDGSRCNSSIVATDRRGNTRTETLSLIFDTTPPVASAVVGCAASAVPMVGDVALWATKAFMCTKVSAEDEESGIRSSTVTLTKTGVAEPVAVVANSPKADPSPVVLTGTIDDGDYDVTVVVTNYAELATTIAMHVIVETTPPSGGAVLLNGGADKKDTTGSRDVTLQVTGFNCGAHECLDPWLRCEHPSIADNVSTVRTTPTIAFPAAGASASIVVAAPRDGPMVCRYGVRTRAHRPARAASIIVYLDSTPPVADPRQPVTAVQSESTVYVFNGAPPIPKMEEAEALPAGPASTTARFWRTGGAAGGSAVLTEGQRTAETCEAALQPFAVSSTPNVLSVAGGFGQDSVTARCVRGAEFGSNAAALYPLLSLSQKRQITDASPFAATVRIARLALQDTEGRSVRTDLCYSAALSAATEERISCPVLVNAHNLLPSGLRSFTSGTIEVTVVDLQGDASIEVRGSSRPGVVVVLPKDLPIGTKLNLFGAEAEPASTEVDEMQDAESANLGLTCEAAVGVEGELTFCTDFAKIPESEAALPVKLGDTVCAVAGKQLAATVRCKNEVLAEWSTKTVPFTFGADPQSFVHSITAPRYVLADENEIDFMWTWDESALAPGTDSSAAYCTACIGSAPFSTDVACVPTVPCTDSSAAVPVENMTDGRAYYAVITGAAPGSKRVVISSRAVVAVRRPDPTPEKCQLDCCPDPQGTLDDGSGTDEISCDFRCGPAAATAPTAFSLSITGGETAVAGTRHIARRGSPVHTASVPIAILAKSTVVGIEAGWNNTAKVPTAKVARWALAANPTVPIVNITGALHLVSPTDGVEVTVVMPEEWRFPNSVGAALTALCPSENGTDVVVARHQWNASSEDDVVMALDTAVMKRDRLVRLQCRLETVFHGRCPNDAYTAIPTPFTVVPAIEMADSCGSIRVKDGTQYCFALAPRSSEVIWSIALRAWQQGAPDKDKDFGIVSRNKTMVKHCVAVADVPPDARFFEVKATNALGATATCTASIADATGPTVEALEFTRYRKAEGIAHEGLVWADMATLCFRAAALESVIGWRIAEVQVAVTEGPGPTAPSAARPWRPVGDVSTLTETPACVAIPAALSDGRSVEGGHKVTIFFRAFDRWDRAASTSATLTLVAMDTVAVPTTDMAPLSGTKIPNGDGDLRFDSAPGANRTVCLQVGRTPPQVQGLAVPVRCTAEAVLAEVNDEQEMELDVTTGAAASAAPIWITANPANRTDTTDTICLPTAATKTPVSVRVNCLGKYSEVTEVDAFFDTEAPQCSVQFTAAGTGAALRGVRRGVGSVCVGTLREDQGITHGLRNLSATLELTPSAGEPPVELETTLISHDGKDKALDSWRTTEHCFELNLTARAWAAFAVNPEQPVGSLQVRVRVEDQVGKESECTTDAVSTYSAKTVLTFARALPGTETAGRAFKRLSADAPAAVIVSSLETYTVTITKESSEHAVVSGTWCVTEIGKDKAECNAVAAQPFAFPLGSSTAQLELLPFEDVLDKAVTYQVTASYVTDAEDFVNLGVVAEFSIEGVPPIAPGFVVVSREGCEANDDDVPRWDPSQPIAVCFSAGQAPLETAISHYVVTSSFSEATADPLVSMTITAGPQETFQTLVRLPAESHGGVSYVSGDVYSVCVVAVDEHGLESDAACGSYMLVTKPPPAPLVNDGVGPCKDQDQTTNIETVNVNWCPGDDAAEFGVTEYTAECFTTHGAKTPVAAKAVVDVTFPPRATFIPPAGTLVRGTTKLSCTVCAQGAVGGPVCSSSNGIAIVSGPVADDVVLSKHPMTGGNVQICHDGQCDGTNRPWTVGNSVRAQWVLCNRAVRTRVCAWVVKDTSAVDAAGADGVDDNEPTGAVCHDHAVGTTQQAFTLALHHKDIVRVDMVCINAGGALLRRSTTAAVVLNAPSFGVPAFPPRVVAGPKVCMDINPGADEVLTSARCSLCGNPAAAKKSVLVRTAVSVAGVTAATENIIVAVQAKTAGATVSQAWVDATGLVHAYVEAADLSVVTIDGVKPNVARPVAWPCCVAAAMCSASLDTAAAATAYASNVAGEASVTGDLTVVTVAKKPTPSAGAAAEVTVRFNSVGVIVCVPIHTTESGAPPRYQFRGVGPSTTTADEYELMRTTKTTLFPFVEAHGNCHTYPLIEEQPNLLQGREATFFGGAIDPAGRTAPCAAATIPIFMTAPEVTTTIDAPTRATTVTCTVTLSSITAPATLFATVGGKTHAVTVLPIGDTGDGPVRYDGSITVPASDITPAPTVACTMVATYGGNYVARGTSGAVEWAPQPHDIVFSPALPSVLLSGVPFVTTVIARDAAQRAVPMPGAAIQMKAVSLNGAEVNIETASAFENDAVAVSITGLVKGTPTAGGPSFGVSVYVVDRRKENALLLADPLTVDGVALQQLDDAAPTVAVALVGPSPAQLSVEHRIVVTVPKKSGGAATADFSTVVTVGCVACFEPSVSVTVAGGVASVPFIVPAYSAVSAAVLRVRVVNAAAGHDKSVSETVAIAAPTATVTGWTAAAPENIDVLTVGGSFSVIVTMSAATPADTWFKVTPHGSVHVLASSAVSSTETKLTVRLLRAPTASVTVVPMSAGVVFTPSSAALQLPAAQEVPVSLRLNEKRRDGQLAFAPSVPSAPPVVGYTVLCETFPRSPDDLGAPVPCRSQAVGDAIGAVTVAQRGLSITHDGLQREITFRAAEGVHLTPWSSLAVAANLSATVDHKESMRVHPASSVNATDGSWLVKPDPAFVCVRDINSADDATQPLVVNTVSGDTTRTFVAFPCTSTFEQLLVASPAIAVTGPAVTSGIAAVAGTGRVGEVEVTLNADAAQGGWNGETTGTTLTLTVGDVTRPARLFRRLVTLFTIEPSFKSAFVNDRLALRAVPRDAFESAVSFAGAPVRVEALTAGCPVTFDGTARPVSAELPLSVLSTTRGDITCEASVRVGTSSPVSISVLLHARMPGEAARSTVEVTEAVAEVRVAMRVCVFDAAGAPIALTADKITAKTITVATVAFAAAPTGTVDGDCAVFHATPAPEAPFAAALLATVTYGADPMPTSSTPRWQFPSELIVTHEDTSSRAVHYEHPGKFTVKLLDAEGAVIHPVRTAVDVCIDSFRQSYAVSSVGSAVEMTPSSRDISTMPSGALRTALCFEMSALPQVQRACVPTDIVTDRMPTLLELDPESPRVAGVERNFTFHLIPYRVPSGGGAKVRIDAHHDFCALLRATDIPGTCTMASSALAVDTVANTCTGRCETIVWKGYDSTKHARIQVRVSLDSPINPLSSVVTACLIGAKFRDVPRFGAPVTVDVMKNCGEITPSDTWLQLKRDGQSSFSRQSGFSFTPRALTQIQIVVTEALINIPYVVFDFTFRERTPTVSESESETHTVSDSDTLPHTLTSMPTATLYVSPSDTSHQTLTHSPSHTAVLTESVSTSASQSLSHSTFLGRPVTHIVVTVPLKADGTAGWHGIGEIRAIDTTGLNVAQGRPVTLLTGNASDSAPLSACVDGDTATRCYVHERNATIAGRYVIAFDGPHDIVELQVHETAGPPGEPYSGRGCFKQQVQLVLETELEKMWQWTHGEINATSTVQFSQDVWGEFSLFRWRVFPRLARLAQSEGRLVRYLHVSTNSTEWHGMSEVRALTAGGLNVAAGAPVRLRTGQVQADLDRCNDDSTASVCLYRRLHSHLLGEWEIDLGAQHDIVEVQVISNTGPCGGTGSSWCARQRVELYDAQHGFNWGTNVVGRDDTHTFPVVTPFLGRTPAPTPVPFATPAPVSVGVWARFVEVFTEESAFMGLHEVEAFAVGSPTVNILHRKTPVLVRGVAKNGAADLSKCVDGNSATFCKYRADEYGSAAWRIDLGSVLDVVGVRTVRPVVECASCKPQAVRLLDVFGKVVWSSQVSTDGGLADTVATYAPQTPIPTPVPVAFSGVFVDRVVVETIGRPVAFQQIAEIAVIDALNDTAPFADHTAAMEAAVASGHVLGLNMTAAADGDNTTFMSIAADGPPWALRDARVTFMLPVPVEMTRFVVRGVVPTPGAAIRISTMRGEGLALSVRTYTAPTMMDSIEFSIDAKGNTNVLVHPPSPTHPPKVKSVLVEIAAGAAAGVLHISDVSLWTAEHKWLRPIWVYAVTNASFSTFPAALRSGGNTTVNVSAAGDGNWSTAAHIPIESRSTVTVVVVFDLNATAPGINGTSLLLGGLWSTINAPVHVSYSARADLVADWNYTIDTVAFDSPSGARRIDMTKSEEATPAPATPAPPSVMRNDPAARTAGRQAVAVILNSSALLSVGDVYVLSNGTGPIAPLSTRATAGIPVLSSPMTYCTDGDNTTVCAVAADPTQATLRVELLGSYDVVKIVLAHYAAAASATLFLEDDRGVMAFATEIAETAEDTTETVTVTIGPLDITATATMTNTLSVSVSGSKNTKELSESSSLAATASPTVAMTATHSQEITDSATITHTDSVSVSSSKKTHELSESLSLAATASAKATATTTHSITTTQLVSETANPTPTVTAVSLGIERATKSLSVSHRPTATPRATPSQTVVPIPQGDPWPVPGRAYATLYLTLFATGRDYFRLFTRDKNFEVISRQAGQRHLALYFNMSSNRVIVKSWVERSPTWGAAASTEARAARAVKAAAVESTLFFTDGELPIELVFDNETQAGAMEAAEKVAAEARTLSFSGDLVLAMTSMMPGNLPRATDGGIATETGRGVPNPNRHVTPAPAEAFVCGVGCLAGVLSAVFVIFVGGAVAIVYLLRRDRRGVSAVDELVGGHGGHDDANGPDVYCGKRLSIDSDKEVVTAAYSDDMPVGQADEVYTASQEDVVDPAARTMTDSQRLPSRQALSFERNQVKRGAAAHADPAHRSLQGTV